MVRDVQFHGALAIAIPVCLIAHWIFAAPGSPLLTVPEPGQLLISVLAFPFVEELAFRGLIQEFLARRMPARWGAISAANLVTSVLFAAAHLGAMSPPAAAARFFPSLVFGYFRERHDSLTSPFILHAFYNASAIMIVG